jgi:Leucine-rich repeat (LRR) protein
LDLSDNIISSLQEVKRLRKMPLLTKLWLTGNPVTLLATYRKQTLLYFYKNLDVQNCDRKYKIKILFKDTNILFTVVLVVVVVVVVVVV